ncbi:hypothetical protein [Urbifossiella limnaea]|uniref:Uncharacterized protein n=1 Tax=Urbifossiella limnaea TaxID=2528023 RepID=A0A517Y1F9_9BACT|nr:hypothetical protein [Urbifossiella limnaea]QDU23611.1 hypothetical protein ETAA1_56150 [Urbifossiella limnaea]
MTLGELLALDYVSDLTNSYMVAQFFTYPSVFDFVPLGPAAVEEIRFLTRYAAAACYSSSAARGVDDAWNVWKRVVYSIRALLRTPPEWRNPYADRRALAVSALAQFAWAPPVARQVARPGAIPGNALVCAVIGENKPSEEVERVIRFLTDALTSGGEEGAFLDPGEVCVSYTPDLAGLMCQQCHALIPLTKTGRIPRRVRCEPCQKAKEYASWKARDPEKARALWRNSKSTDRRQPPPVRG